MTTKGNLNDTIIEISYLNDAHIPALDAGVFITNKHIEHKIMLKHNVFGEIMDKLDSSVRALG